MNAAELNSGVDLPTRKRGRPSAAAAATYRAQSKAFCDFIKSTAKTIDFRPSARGWAYLLENARLIDKSGLDTAQNLINDARKSGDLPLDICSEDAKREWRNVERIDEGNPADEADVIKESVEQWISRYRPRSFWADKKYFIQMVVEKIDLRELFLPVCKRWHVPVANGGGWSDINMRGELAKRFSENLAPGQIPVVLYCGDFDPVGLQISENLRENIKQLSVATGWWNEELVVDRFGLSHGFIEQHEITWIDNLQTSSKGAINDLSDPRHKHHRQAHVQDYIRQYGARKVEANALVTRSQAGRDLCEAAILKYMHDPDLPEQFERDLAPDRAALREAIGGQGR